MLERIELSPGYTIARVLNGLWQLSPGHTLKGQLDLEEINQTFHQLGELGFTTFDLADIYTGAEEALGRYLKELDHHSYLTAHDIQIHEKYVPDIDVLESVKFEDTEAIIDRSLKKLGRDYIDLMQFHWWDYSVDRYIEVAEHLVKLQEKGKIRYIGVTNFDTPHLKELVDAGLPIISCQSQYSLFDRRPEKKLLPYSIDQGIQQLCFGTLSGGLLSDKYLNQTDIDLETRSQVKYQQVIDQSLGQAGYQKLLHLLDEIAHKHRVSISNVATRYILQQEGVAGSIIGIRNHRHVKDNLAIFDFILDQEDLEAIRSLLDQYPRLPGDCYELERDPHSIFSSIIRRHENANG
ncbi:MULTISPECIES: aldo/keto reductase [Aerococcus]|uniref:Aldo/keto reductase n=2 Tax=Aerococcus TaxID=1375 RepID=A0A5N1GNM4_9LACT|nr:MULTISPECIES: aldo/keto reductase [Aerococcus]KAA9300330.1 aldo/keto reductase [Aerococcus sanguinicola]MDK6369867.1 aldo/keto reductase [Aerococcus sp. UMB9870]MDK6678857.1 aldo/keto reductase [Aerococcus sp. UMB8608]MDK6686825.1 aldo/keto reductase [Aerococcus sp. UMB8623]MDK6939515.1 aldo/keto reductase [Aerococcus sp. UMB8487]